MPKEVIHASGAPSSPLYSQAIKAGGLVYLSGFTGIDAATRQLAGETIEEQTRQAILNCREVLKAAGSSLEQVIQVTVLLSDPDDFEGMNQEYAKSFPKNPPARMVTKLGVSLPKVKISMAMIAITV
jgi:2-iminobutanoate/2-iminopropanoate deaminase